MVEKNNMIKIIFFNSNDTEGKEAKRLLDEKNLNYAEILKEDGCPRVVFSGVAFAYRGLSDIKSFIKTFGKDKELQNI